MSGMGCQRPASLRSPECCELSRDATLCAQHPAESGTEAATAAERLPQAPGWARGPGLGGNLQFSPGWIAKVEPTGLLMCKKRRDSTNSSFGPELQQRAISIPGSAQSAKRSFCCDRQPGKTHGPPEIKHVFWKGLHFCYTSRALARRSPLWPA